MKQLQPHGRPDDTGARTRSLRRIVITAALAVVGLVVILAAIYAGVFLILAPMMQ